MDDVTTVDRLSQGMDRHARHLRLEKIARPEQGHAAAIPRGKASVDVPTPPVSAVERFLAKFVDAVGHEQIGLKPIDDQAAQQIALGYLARYVGMPRVTSTHEQNSHLLFLSSFVGQQPGLLKLFDDVGESAQFTAAPCRDVHHVMVAICVVEDRQRSEEHTSE